MYKNFILPASILAGTVIGAGMFSLPFVFKEAGLMTSLFYLGIFGLTFIFIYFLYADLILRTSGDHRFVGYAKLYLGDGGFWAALLIGLVQLFFVLTIYLILAPSFSKLFISDGYLYHLLGFWLIGSIAILFDTRRVALTEFLIVGGMVAIIVLIFGFGSQNIFSINLGDVDISKFLVAGPILFALSGSLAVPEVVSYFRESKIPLSYLKQSLVLGGFLPIIAYIMLVLGIWGSSPVVSEDAVSGLIGQVPMSVLSLMGILGFLSLISSYIVVGLNTRRILEYDLNFSKWLSRILVIVMPLALYFAGLKSFIDLVSFIGLIFMPIESIFIIFMWLGANKKSEMPSMLVGRAVRSGIPILLLLFISVIIYVIIK